jgi:hypothetical protein
MPQTASTGSATSVATKKSIPSKSATRAKPVRAAAKPAMPAVAPKAAASKRAAKPAAKAAQTTKATKASKSTKASKPAKAAEMKKPKLIRDSFTLPQADHDLIKLCKKTALAAGRDTKKSEVVRAAIQSFASLSHAAQLAAYAKLQAIALGRPKAK